MPAALHVSLSKLLGIVMLLQLLEWGGHAAVLPTVQAL